MILLLTIFSSCTSTTIDEFRQGETGIESDELVVILGRRQKQDYETSSGFVECVGERMMRGDGAISIVPERQFIDAMFPWFEPRTAPTDPRGLEVFLETEPRLKRRLEELRIRYMVWLDGVTETTDRAGTLSCAIAPGGGACFGGLTWSDDANFTAMVWDVGSDSNGERQEFVDDISRDGSQTNNGRGSVKPTVTAVGTISAEATGQSFMPAIIVPIPLIARVEANACQRLADQLKQFVNGS